jgi:hypothetical protein
MRVYDQDKSNCDSTYMASFWKENQLVWTDKKNLKENSWFKEPKCKLGFKIVQFLVLFHWFFLPLLLKLWKWKPCHGLSTLLMQIRSFIFDQFKIWHGWFYGSSEAGLLEGVHFQAFQMHKMEVKQKVG